MPHPKYILKSTHDDRYHFNLTARNGHIILTSQTYLTKSSAIKGIESVQINSLIQSQYIRNTASNGLFYFDLKASNGIVIGTSEMYASLESRETGIESVKRNGQIAEVDDQTLLKVF